jgi:hypothetical protein
MFVTSPTHFALLLSVDRRVVVISTNLFLFSGHLIKDEINKLAFSGGGRGTKELQVSCQEGE